MNLLRSHVGTLGSSCPNVDRSWDVERRVRGPIVPGVDAERKERRPCEETGLIWGYQAEVSCERMGLIRGQEATASLETHHEDMEFPR